MLYNINIINFLTMLDKIINYGVYSSLIDGAIYHTTNYGDEISYILFELEDAYLIDDSLKDFNHFLVWIRNGYYRGFKGYADPSREDVLKDIERFIQNEN